VPIILYNLVQQVVAGIVDRRVHRMMDSGG